MAYLLTEIALEMLGCRFYDVYGNPHDMGDIQNDIQEQKLERELTGIDKNENLENIINFGQISAEERIRKLKDKNLAKRSHHSSSQQSTESTPLVSLINKESNLVKEQVLKNKAKLCKQLHHITEGNAAQLMVRKFIEIEIINLRREAQNMRTFRNYVEHNIMNIKPASFEKYCRTFATRFPKTTKSTNKTTTI